MKIEKGQCAVVTGAASGIGLALCEAFTAAGLNVVMADIEAPRLEQAAAGLANAEGKAKYKVCDVRKADQLDALAAFAESEFGAVHILCNNAGVFVGGAAWENTAADYQGGFDVNVAGIANGLRAFVPKMIAHGEPAHIVNTASMAALTTMPFSSVYCMSKAAALHLNECCYKELQVSAPHISVSVLCPELVDTDISKAGRNRPQELSAPGDLIETEFSKMPLQAITESTATGVSPALMAEKVMKGIAEDRFYLLADDFWHDIAMARLEDIRAGDNPRMVFGDDAA